jgi:hypothetical protein
LNPWTLCPMASTVTITPSRWLKYRNVVNPERVRSWTFWVNDLILYLLNFLFMYECQLKIPVIVYWSFKEEWILKESVFIQNCMMILWLWWV